MLKPIDHNIDLIYECECGRHRWLTLKEAQTTGFKIVCVCGVVSTVDPVVDIKLQIVYRSSEHTIEENQSSQAKIQSKSANINLELLQQTQSCLKNLGYKNIEIKGMISKIDMNQYTKVEDIITKILER
jgi:hypothetical protein